MAVLGGDEEDGVAVLGGVDDEVFLVCMDIGDGGDDDLPHFPQKNESDVFHPQVQTPILV
jgi:hypothetical protein